MSNLNRTRVYRYEQARDVAERFERLLSDYGINPKPGSSLERMTLSVYDVLYRRQEGLALAQPDVRFLFADMAALTELATQILSVRTHRDFNELIPHLEILNRGEAAQNRKIAPAHLPEERDAGNKIFEILAACLAMRCGVDVRLEGSGSSSAPNPDVLVTMRGRRWGIACKVLHSLHPESVIENVKKGIEQIDRSEAEVGFVLVNLKNVIDHEKYWRIQNEEEWKSGAEPVFQTFIIPDIPRILLEGEVKDIATSMGHYVGSRYLQEIFDKSRSLNGVMLYVHVMSGIVGPDGRPMPMSQRWPTWAGIQSLTDDEEGSLGCFNYVAQDIP